METEVNDSAAPATKADVAMVRGDLGAFRVWVEGRLELADQRLRAMQDLVDHRFRSAQEHTDQRFAAVDQKLESVEQRLEQKLEQKLEAARQETRALISEGVGAIKDRMLTFFILHFLALIGAVLAVNRWS